jgi:hypothetical protein
VLYERHGGVARIVQGDPAQSIPLEQSAELVRVPLGVNRYTQLVHDDVRNTGAEQWSAQGSC